MEQNKFNKYYLKKSESELLTQFLSHKLTGSLLDKEWYEALRTHLSQREMSVEMNNIYSKILNESPDDLKLQERLIQQEIDDLNIKNENSSKNVLKTSPVHAAGKSLKNVVYAQILIFIFLIISILINQSTDDIETIKNVYIGFGVLSLICTVIILTNLFRAGDHLENS